MHMIDDDWRCPVNDPPTHDGDGVLLLSPVIGEVVQGRFKVGQDGVRFIGPDDVPWDFCSDLVVGWMYSGGAM